MILDIEDVFYLLLFLILRIMNLLNVLTQYLSRWDIWDVVLYKLMLILRNFKDVLVLLLKKYVFRITRSNMRIEFELWLRDSTSLETWNFDL